MVVVEAEAREFGDAELFAEDTRGVVVLEDPVVETRFDAAGAVEEGIFRSVEELLRAGKQRFTGTEQLQLVAEIDELRSAESLGRAAFSRR